ncbi:hypothetical protein PIB30_038396, partial [Stylosanthes scabra]|nr:hypothetical protein [Stylosanthes scabra]
MTLVVVNCILLIIIDLLTTTKYTKKKSLVEKHDDEGDKEDLELPIFDLATIVKAAGDFSFSNKLGEGGFGTVY